MVRRTTPMQLIGNTLAWVGVWVVISLAVSDGQLSGRRVIFRLLPQILGITTVVLINVGVLLPKLYFTRRRGWYYPAAAFLIVLLVGFFYYGWADPNAGLPRFRPRRNTLTALVFLFPLILALLGSTAVAVMRWAGEQERAKIQAEKEQLTTEIKFLKSQINPHFLFNSLNNIYTLSLLKDDLAPESLLRLSGMLRYMLYEAEAERVPLSKEINYLKDYIALARLKDSRGLNISLVLDETQPHLPIAPLLFIPLVENAFKHGKIEQLASGFISIKLSTTTSSITFQVSNNYGTDAGAKDGTGGIGLNNVRKRMDLLYPGRHTFRAAGDGDIFRAEINIQLT